MLSPARRRDTTTINQLIAQSEADETAALARKLAPDEELTESERIARLEAQVRQLERTVDDLVKRNGQ